jgi:Leucine-rich repeat (LRR) protein
VFGKDFENMANIEIDELVINNYNLMRLPEKVFMDSNEFPISLIRKISIKNSPNLMYLGFTSPSNYTFFDGLGQSLETIYIENCNGIRQDQWPRFSKSLTSESVLRTVNFYANSYPIENFDAFNDLPNIEKIYMRNNNLYKISADLSKFLNLKVLDLSNNKLNDFELKGNSPHLTSIYLRANTIQIIKESLLKVVQNLMRIDFTGLLYYVFVVFSFIVYLVVYNDVLCSSF